jgi:hypothetical protein
MLDLTHRPIPERYTCDALAGILRETVRERRLAIW